MSKRCQLYHAERVGYIQLKDKAIKLVERAKTFFQRVPADRKQIKAKAELIQLNVQKRHFLLKEKIKEHEEIMIRKGCPGIQYRGDHD